MEDPSADEMATEKVDRGGNVEMGRLLLFAGAPCRLVVENQPPSRRPRREHFCDRGVVYLAKLFLLACRLGYLLPSEAD